VSPQTRRVVIILAAVSAVLLLTCVVCGLSGAVSCTRFFGEASEQAQRTIVDADAFGAAHAQADCPDEGLRRQDACGATDLMCRTQVGVFLQRCLDHAQPTPGFCDAVPTASPMEMAQWSLARCASIGRPGDQICSQTMQTIPMFCRREGMRGPAPVGAPVAPPPPPIAPSADPAGPPATP
jgi:hypothetical protein